MTWSIYLTDLLTRYLFLGDNTVDSPLAEPGTSPYVALTNHNPQDVNDTDLISGELSGNGYTRMAYPFAWDTSGSFIYNSSIINFPKATGSNWVIYHVLLMDRQSGGNLLFQVPMYDAAPIAGNYIWQYTVPVGQGLRLNTPLGLILAVRGHESTYPDEYGGYPVPVPPSVENGGMTATHARKILQWVFNINQPFPDSRTYNIAIGRNAEFTPSPYGHLKILPNGNPSWTECSGRGYQRITLTADDWYSLGASSHAVSNSREILFTDSAPENWGEITDFLLYPLNDNKTPAFWGHFSTHLNISAGQPCAIGPDKIRIMFYGLTHSGY